MNSKQTEWREQLLQQLPPAADAQALAEQIKTSVAHEDIKLKRQRWIVQSLWIFCAFSSAYFAWFHSNSTASERSFFLAGFMLVWGMAAVLQHRLNALRVEVLREIKLLQLHVLQLNSSRGETRGSSTSPAP